jgi:hypothetical protein
MLNAKITVVPVHVAWAEFASWNENHPSPAKPGIESGLRAYSTDDTK